MKLFTTFFLILTFTLAALPAGPTSIIVTPKAPKFTDAERHAELARRRAAVVAKMADKSILVMFSAEPRLYTNDVDYVYRQENNLFYLTGLKQDGATLVITKDGGAVTETLFIPKRVPLREAWEGRMYSREQVSQISGMKTIIDASEQPAFLAALRSKAAFTAKEGGTSIPTSAESIYMLLPQGENDENGRREFHVEDHFAKENKTLKFVNAQPIFGELRLIKSPFELKILQHAVDISTEAHACNGDCWACRLGI
ncbi:MAG: aminopeptidase P N-terminal domain-containing protein [Acidobacteria bacterium]|nr:aminopeptidase P N-terminal domain-containing protein [Acidobacteriota bacterium]